jgi:hypothetical protein
MTRDQLALGYFDAESRELKPLKNPVIASVFPKSKNKIVTPVSVWIVM